VALAVEHPATGGLIRQPAQPSTDETSPENQQHRVDTFRYEHRHPGAGRLLHRLPRPRRNALPGLHAALDVPIVTSNQAALEAVTHALTDHATTAALT